MAVLDALDAALDPAADSNACGVMILVAAALVAAPEAFSAHVALSFDELSSPRSSLNALGAVAVVRSQLTSAP